MSLLTAGYWPTTYWPKDYWPADFWPEFAVEAYPNYTTADAITTNLEAIIVAQGFQLEDLTTDPEADTTPLCQLWIEGEDYTENYGEAPTYNEIRYALEIKLRNTTPDTSRGVQQLWPAKLRQSININTLNVGALAISKLVSRVRHAGPNVDYEPPMTRIIYRLTVRYREQ